MIKLASWVHYCCSRWHNSSNTVTWLLKFASITYLINWTIFFLHMWAEDHFLTWDIVIHVQTKSVIEIFKLQDSYWIRMQKHVIKFIIMLYFIEYFPILALTIHVTVAVIVIGRNGCAFAVITSRHGSRFRRQRRPHGGPLQLRSHQRPLMNASTLLSATIFSF